MEDTALVVGLGNPGPNYAKNRHNFGFLVLDELKSQTCASNWQKKFKGDFSQGRLQDRRIFLLKPMTFMNLSGQSTALAAQYYQISSENIIVIHDDLDLPFETVRVKYGGGTGGHKGIASIKQQLGTANFIRVRMGIGRPPHGNATNYVLDNFSSKETLTLMDVIAHGAEAVEYIVCRDVNTAMNKFNKRGGEGNEC